MFSEPSNERYTFDEAFMDVDNATGILASEDQPCDPTVRKRFRGSCLGAVPPLAAPAADVGPTSACGEVPPHPRGAVPTLNLTAAAAAGQAQAQAQLEARQQHSGTAKRLTIAERSDAPAMLNLEEINMSEEEMISSYDPHNEENNYHLPDHLYKALQLKQYRQACSEVVPKEVYLGGYQVAGDLECLRRNRITHIVNMAADVCDSAFPEHFSYITYYLKDTNSEDISPLFYRTLEWMQSAIDAGGRILVHCREGVSRSATMAIAYLMWRFKISFEAAHERLRKARPICNPNTGFTCQLLVLGKRLGISNAGQQAALAGSPDRPVLFRVAPHHPKEPFLLLAPADWPQSWPQLDPRFGWAVQRGARLLLWLGSQVPDPAAAEAAVHQQARWVEVFEQRSLTVTVMAEGEELPQFWQALAAAPCGAPAAGCGIAAMSTAFDADHEVLRASAACAVGVPVGGT